ncbi:MAG: hypothetical protein HN969_11400 [Verrucomicrobia bacterium]|jgi:hypothetical protein|nr:hypothetical protein [Verrucomicrobiota bacterium]
MKLVYGFYGWNSTLQIASVDAAEGFASSYEELAAIGACNDYQEIRTLLGDEEFDWRFGELIQEAWEDQNRDSQNNQDCPPSGWEPPFAPPDSGELFNELSGVNSPSNCGVPSEILELGSRGFSISSGEMVDWGDTTKNHLEAVQEVCVANVWQLVERQDLFDRMTNAVMGA